MDSPAQDLTTRPIPEHNGDQMRLLIKVMILGKLRVQFGAIVAAVDCAGVSASLKIIHVLPPWSSANLSRTKRP